MTPNIQNKKIFELMQQQGVLAPKSSAQNVIEDVNSSFESILREQTYLPPLSTGEKFGVKLSKHAQLRMEERNIQFDDNDWKAIHNGLNQAASKGAKESLFIMDEVALVVGIPNKTVITVVDKENLKDNVFTKIDSALILQKETVLEEELTRLDPLGDLNNEVMNDLLSSQIKTQINKTNKGNKEKCLQQ